MRGFTAIELMVTVAILAVLMALAAPSFTPLIERWRVRQAVEGLQSTLYYARSEAIKRGGNVIVRKLPNNTNGCTTAGNANSWDCGWQVLSCTSITGSSTCNGSAVLQRFDAPAKVHVTRHSGGQNIVLNRWGLVAGTYVGFNLVPLDQSTSHPAARGLCMSSGGRIRVIPSEEIPCSS
nr:GspH/FimT family pseudopilin [Acidovorax sp. MR-S7]